MKKIISCMLAVCLLLCFSACKKAAPAGDAAAPTEGGAESTEPIVLDVPFLAVGLPTIEEKVTAKDGAIIFMTSRPYMTLTINGQVTADLIINDFMNRVSNGMSDAEEREKAASESYQLNSSNWTAHGIEMNCLPTRIDPNVLSIYGTIVSNAGSSHPEHACVSANYNLVSGDVLTLGSILTHEDKIPELRDLLISKLEAQAAEKFLREEFQEDIRQRFANDISFDEDWYFSQEGLCFYFAPYQIAPYSSGVITAVIPYSELVGIIEEEFFPAESSFSNGNPTVLSFTPDAASYYEQTSELILDHEGQKFLIEADSCIQNIQIVKRAIMTDRNDIMQVCYTAYCLNPGNAIMVQLPKNDNMQYYVEYMQDGNTVSIPITVQ